MLIDKSKFMVLVAAISASATACVIKEADGNGGGGGGGSTADGGSGPGTGGSTSDGGGGSTADGGGGQGGAGGAGGGESCLDDTGTPDACSSECEAADFPPDGISTCDGVQHLKAGVAVAAVNCLNALDSSSCSSYADGYQDCYLGALALACHDPAVESTCTELATACGATDDAAWQSECSKNLSGLTASGRALVEACMEAFCDDEDPFLYCTLDAYYDYD